MLYKKEVGRTDKRERCWELQIRHNMGIWEGLINDLIVLMNDKVN